MTTPTPAEAIEELKRRGVVVSSESVLEEKETSFDEFKKAAESLLKGSAAGLVSIVGGWGNLYDYLNKSKDPSAFSSTGIMRGLKDLVDLQEIKGYKGAYEFGQSAAPAMAMTAAGLPGLFPRTAGGLVGEGAVAGTTGLLSQTIAPDSPLAQLAIQSSPYALKGAVTTVRSSMLRPTGTVPTTLDDLLRVGRMTPGEATGSRVQLGREATVAASPTIESKGTAFKQAQAADVESFLNQVFERSSSKAVSPEQATEVAFTAFQNYGKNLASKLRQDSTKDFGAAKASGGTIDTTPVVAAVDDWMSKIYPETPGFEQIKAAIAKIKQEYSIPAQEAKITPSTVLGPTGEPAYVSITPAVPAGIREISIDRLQKNLSAWGKTVYSGTADFGNGNIFAGVAPGQAKGVALSVLRGFRDALDNAIDAGVPGAEKLKQARDNFKANLNQIEEYSGRPLTKYFDKPNPTDLTPEDVMTKLAASPPSERAFLAQVLQNNPQGYALWDTVRKTQFKELIGKATKAAAGGTEGSPTVSLPTLLSELNSKKGDFSHLFPSAADKADATLAIQFMQKVLKTEGGTSTGAGTGEVSRVVSAAGGDIQTRSAVSEIWKTVRELIATPNAMADVIFNPETVKIMAESQKKGKLVKTGELSTSLAASLAKFAPRVGPMLDTAQPETAAEPLEAPVQPNPQGSPSVEQVLEELQKRGIKVE